jgi:hypothetical protein
MNPTVRLSLLVAGAGVALTAWTPASASLSSTARHPLGIHAALTSFDFVDLGEPGVTAGDFFVQTDTLTLDDHTTGTDIIHCVATGGEAAPGLCDAALTLEDGTLTASGTIPNFEPADGEPFRIAITGGTQRYRRARGHITVTETADGYTATIELQP